MKWYFGGIGLIPLLAAGCVPGPVAQIDPCSGTPVAAQPDSTVVIYAEQQPACSLEVRPIVSLAGELDGVAPRAPIVRGPDGTYLSGTYEPGVIAHWAVDGSLLRTIGRGRGEGPGEFDSANGITVLGDSLVLITTGLQRWHIFRTNGDFVETNRAETTGGVGSVALTESGALFGATQDNTYGIFFTWENGETRKIPIPNPHRTRPLWSRGGSETWYAWPYEYRVHRLDLAGEILRENVWISADAPMRGNLFQVSIDERDLIWVGARVPDPNAPSEARSEVFSPSASEREEEIRRYDDVLIEAMTVDGRLVVSVRFDGVAQAPRPMRGGGWYRESSDPLPVITIVEPVLQPRD
jgi:hypothetical protein